MNALKALLMSCVVLISGCSSQAEEPLKIITNSWIGYSPLFYAKEQGWLEEHNIELSTVVSLGESTHIYHSAKLDGFTGTQYEFNKAYAKDSTLIPIMMFDRSVGGDMIMSNRNLETLQALPANQTIDVFLEIDSINYPLFKDFKQHYGLSNRSFNLINNDHLKMQRAIAEKDSPSIIVTYAPYNHELENQGFMTIASTGDGLNLLVLDALYTNKENYHTHQQQFLALKTIVNRAIRALKQNPKNYYDKVNPYLENTSYSEFQESLRTIEWLNGGISPSLIDRINEAQFPIRDLL
ncbi:ABC-type nitrate/sulfonate/bicarbonate transport systems periplasmic components-like protein [Hydrogenovibrio crunogenus]|uniref:ABC-type nitrate/sulfonate/bicarbonate transport systems periplasmic components-like protein n=1 Tax=Hydrogenovibrio crunogenus TaxID=39765 RepID=A0A4P7P1R8_9GAMM|nr:ABC transporter substrate-binding protein [Hydrogenovibrio crunogenus]QBZ84067.1 ABC-type nitrate/sulfonate/bicarbonate transport systems periplasmic components-like protein [Hydrogenovibrio crunogenus]RUM92037.1 MAG: hypothetical protein DSZ27_04685 [Thiomicrospira sp.]